MTKQNAPLLTKADYLAGKKTIKVEYKWGEAGEVEVKALSYRFVDQLYRRGAENDWEAHEVAHAIVISSLGAVETAELLLEQLSIVSRAEVQRVAMAFALGEKAIKNGVPATEAPATGLTTSSEPSASSSQPDGTVETSAPGQSQESSFITTSSVGFEPELDSLRYKQPVHHKKENSQQSSVAS